MTNQPAKNTITSVTIIGALIALASLVVKRVWGFDIDAETQDVIVNQGVQLWADVQLLGGSIMAIIGRIRAKQTVSITAPIVAPKAASFAIALAAMIVLSGCAAGVQTTNKPGAIKTTALPHSTVTSDGEAISVATAGESPYYALYDSSGTEVTHSGQAAILTLTLDNASVGVSSPKDTVMRGVRIVTTEGVEIEFDELSTDISSPIAARTEQVEFLTQYAMKVSDDEAAKFIAQWKAIDASIGNALEAAVEFAKAAQVVPIP